MPKIEDVAKKWEAAFKSKDLQALTQLYTKDAVVTDPFYPEPLRGHEAIRKDASDFFRSMPDLSMKTVSVMSKDDRTGWVEARMTGTNTGPFVTPQGEFPATGRRVEMEGATMVKLDENGLIKEEKRYYDTGAVLRQLGVGAAEVAEERETASR